MLDREPIKGYLVDLVDHSRLEFQFNPSEVTDAKDTNLGEAVIPGRSHPRYQFVAGGAREIRFQLAFFKVPDLKAKVRWLQSLQYPTHAGAMLRKAPHHVLFVFGTLFTTTCVMKSIQARYFDLFDLELEPERAEVDLVLLEDVEASVSPEKVREP